MPELAIALPVGRAPAATASRRLALFERPLLSVGVSLVVLIVLLAVLVPVLPLQDPNITAPARRLSGAGVNGYVLGSDQLGRDLLSRLLWGARVALFELRQPRAVGDKERQ